jgi:hypothetical protein
LNIPDAQNTKIVGVNKNSSFGTPTHKASILYYIAQQKKKKKKRFGDTTKHQKQQGECRYTISSLFLVKKRKKKLSGSLNLIVEGNY